MPTITLLNTHSATNETESSRTQLQYVCSAQGQQEYRLQNIQMTYERLIRHDDIELAHPTMWLHTHLLRH